MPSHIGPSRAARVTTVRLSLLVWTELRRLAYHDLPLDVQSALVSGCTWSDAQVLLTYHLSTKLPKEYESTDHALELTLYNPVSTMDLFTETNANLLNVTLSTANAKLRRCAVPSVMNVF